MASISLLVPCYNAERYLSRFWDDLQKHTEPFEEIILYDDASTDNTAEIAESYPGVRLIRGKKNIGAGAARNELAKAAKCEFIHFHDVDDPIQPNFLERMLPHVNDSHDVIIANSDWFAEEDGSLVIRWQYKNDELQRDAVDYLINNPVAIHTSIIRRENFERIGGFNTRLKIHEDSDLHVRLAADGARFHVVEEMLFISIRHDRGVSACEAEIPHYRLQALKGYAAEFDKKYHQSIGMQAAKAANSFCRLGDRKALDEAIHLCEQMGLKLPLTSNPAMRLVNSFLPTHTALKLQYSIRRKLSNHQQKRSQPAGQKIQ